MQSKLSSTRFGRAAPRTTAPSLPTVRWSMPSREVRPWGRLSWPLSLALFVVPVALVVTSLLAPRFASAPQVDIRVTDRYTGRQISNAELILDTGVLRTGPDGSSTVELVGVSVPLTVEAPGYESVTTTLARGGPADWQVALRPTVLHGRLSDSETSSGIAGATVTIVAPNGMEHVSTTDSDGRYAFEQVPEGATVRFSSVNHGVAEVLVGERTE